MSSTEPKSRLVTVRVDSDAWTVIEWYTRAHRTTPRGHVRTLIERDAERISNAYDLPERPPTEPALGKFAPQTARTTNQESSDG